MKVLFIAAINVVILIGCSTPEHQPARKADSALLTDTMPALRPQHEADKMPVIPMDTSKSDMPVVRPSDSIQAK